MNTNIPRVYLYSPVPIEYQREGIKFLVLERDPCGGIGWFIYLHKSLEEPCFADEWYEDKSQAENVAVLSYGVTPVMWKPLNSETYHP